MEREQVVYCISLLLLFDSEVEFAVGIPTVVDRRLFSLREHQPDSPQRDISGWQSGTFPGLKSGCRRSSGRFALLVMRCGDAAGVSDSRLRSSSFLQLRSWIGKRTA